MLVLTRKVDEAIIVKVGDVEVRVTVVDIRLGSVRIGIDAPRDCPITRDELLTGGDYAQPSP